MKKTIQTSTIIFIMMLLNFSVSAQVTVLGNNGISTDYVGWDANQNFPLIIAQKRTVAPQPIDFMTNNTQQMRLNSGGNLRIGNTNNTYKLDVSGDI